MEGTQGCVCVYWSCGSRWIAELPTISLRIVCDVVGGVWQGFPDLNPPDGPPICAVMGGGRTVEYRSNLMITPREGITG